MSQTDIQHFKENGSIEERLRIGTFANQSLGYVLALSESAGAVSVSLDNNRLTVKIPKSEAAEWTSTEKVSIEGSQIDADGANLGILVEKDFACLTLRKGDDDKDSFPHPGASKSC